MSMSPSGEDVHPEQDDSGNKQDPAPLPLSSRAPSLTISLVRAICVAGVAIHHWFEFSNWLPTHDPGVKAPSYGGVLPLIILPWIIFVAGYLEVFSRSLLWERLLWFALYIILGVVVNVVAHCDLDRLFKGEGWRARGGGDRALTGWEVVGHMGFVIFLAFWTLILRPFKWFVVGTWARSSGRRSQSAPNPQDEAGPSEGTQQEPLIPSAEHTEKPLAAPGSREYHFLLGSVFFLLVWACLYHFLIVPAPHLPWSAGGVFFGSGRWVYVIGVLFVSACYRDPWCCHYYVIGVCGRGQDVVCLWFIVRRDWSQHATLVRAGPSMRLARDWQLSSTLHGCHPLSQTTNIPIGFFDAPLSGRRRARVAAGFCVSRWDQFPRVSGGLDRRGDRERLAVRSDGRRAGF